jgi:hypothetical protein
MQCIAAGLNGSVTIKAVALDENGGLGSKEIRSF